MTPSTRRDFLKRSSVGLAAIGASGLLLRAGAVPTPSDGTLHKHRHILDTPVPDRVRRASLRTGDDWEVTPSDQLGPFHRPGSPFRGKVTPPLEPGGALVVTGRVWGYDSREPLPGAVLDVWQADIGGDYEDDLDDVRLRVRIAADEEGYFEYETIYPGNYGGRPAHIHHIVRHPGYTDLVTQLYFTGDRNNANERINERLIIDLEEVSARGGAFRRGVFDIVLAPEA